MPVLIVALVALAVFGIIGVLLFTAETLERRQAEKDKHAASASNNPTHAA